MTIYYKSDTMLRFIRSSQLLIFKKDALVPITEAEAENQEAPQLVQALVAPQKSIARDALPFELNVSDPQTRGVHLTGRL